MSIERASANVRRRFLQLSSGTAGSPKTVQINRANIGANDEAMFVGANFDMPTNVVVS